MENTPLPFLHEIEKLKHLPRTGWLRTIESPESVAAHSFRVAILALLAPENLNLDRAKCMQMALVHDLAESVIGDIPTFAGVPKDRKYELEHNGFQYLESLLRTYSPERAKGIRELWLEYEKGETPEAQWVREMDKFECLVQAHEYEQKTFGKKNLAEFQGLSAKIYSPEATQWANFLRQERDDHLTKRKRRLPIIFITGGSSASENVAGYVAKALRLPCISMEETVRERAKDDNYPHHVIFQTCLDRDLDVPVSLIVGLIEKEIKVVGENEWILVAGFPKDTEQLAEFERKVQHSNYAFYVDYTPSSPNSRQMTTDVDYAKQGWKSPASDFRDDLKRSTVYFEELVKPREELCELTGKSVADFIKSVNADD